MKKLTILLCVALMGLAYGQETKHQISFGANQNVAWNGTSTSAKFDSSLDIDDYTSGNGNFSINYMYSVLPKLQIGFLIDNETSNTEIKFDSGSKSKNESKSTARYLLLNYNFNTEYKDSWYIGFGLGQEKFSDESEDTSGNKSAAESTVDATVFYIGKRFSLEFIGIKNITYSPMVSYIRGKVSGDLEAEGIEEMGIFTIDVLKFDLLF